MGVDFSFLVFYEFLKNSVVYIVVCYCVVNKVGGVYV